MLMIYYSPINVCLWNLLLGLQSGMFNNHNALDIHTANLSSSLDVALARFARTAEEVGGGFRDQRKSDAGHMLKPLWEGGNTCATICSAFEQRLVLTIARQKQS